MMMIVFDNFTGKHVEFENTPFKEKQTIKACVKEKPIESENMWGIPKKKLLESENIWEIPHSNNAIYERDDEDDEDMYGSENTSWLENRCDRSETQIVSEMNAPSQIRTAGTKMNKPLQQILLVGSKMEVLGQTTIAGWKMDAWKISLENLVQNQSISKSVIVVIYYVITFDATDLQISSNGF